MTSTARRTFFWNRSKSSEFDRAFLRDTSLAERRKREREKRKQKLDGHLCVTVD